MPAPKAKSLALSNCVEQQRKLSAVAFVGFLLRIYLDLRLALRNIVRQWRRSLIACSAIGFGVVAMMLTSGYIGWILWANKEGTVSNQFGHLQVVRPGYYDGGQADIFAFLLPRGSTALDELTKTRGMASISPRLSFTGLVSHQEKTIAFIGEGIDPDKDPSTEFVLIVEGGRLTSSIPNGVLMGAGLAANLGVKAGDTVVLLANTSTGGINAVEGIVVGLASVSMKAFDDAVLRVPIDMARQLLRVEGAHVWLAMLHNADQLDSVVKEMRSTEVMSGYDVVPWTELADFYNKTAELFSRQIGVVKLIIGIIIILSISNTMTMSVIERTTEIGTAMALGLRRRRILTLFILEGLLLGAFGGGAGVMIGYVAAEAISAIGIPMPPAPGMSRGFTAGIIITPKIIVDGFALAFTTTLIASLFPAWRASRLNIVDALRHNR